MFDSTGEFANMVCGTWLTRACARRRFDLQPPVVSVVPGASASTGEDEELLLINDWPVKLAASKPFQVPRVEEADGQWP